MIHHAEADDVSWNSLYVLLCGMHRQLFTGMLAELDEDVGAVLGQIRSRGLENDTLIIFLSDNGTPTQELTSSNGSLRSGKGQLLSCHRIA